MTKTIKPLGGAVGSTGAASHTGQWPYRSFWLATLAILLHDLLGDSKRLTSVAFGIDIPWVALVILLAGRATLLGGLGFLYIIYSCYSKVSFRDDRIGFGRAWGRDIGLWSAVFSWFACILVFAFVVPQGVFGYGRCITLVLAHVFAQIVLALIVAHIVWAQRFGRPQGLLTKLFNILTLRADFSGETTGAPCDTRKDISYAAWERSEVAKNRRFVAWHKEGIPKAVGFTMDQLRWVPTDPAWAANPDRLVGRLGFEKAADFCADCGLVAFEEHEFVLAELWQKHALRWAERMNSNKVRAYANHELGMIAASQGRYSVAEQHYRRSLALKDIEDSSVTLSQLGIALSEQGQYEEAAKTFLESVRFAHGEMDYEEVETVRVNFRINVRKAPAHLQPSLRSMWKSSGVGEL